MGAMTRLYEERNMGIVEEDTFDLEKEYETYYDESTLADRIKFGIEVAKNNFKYRGDKKLVGAANKVSAAEIGTLRSANNMSKVVDDTYGKFDKGSINKLMDANDEYGKSKRRENKYKHKLKLAEKDKAAQQPAADNKARQPKPTFRPAYV